MWRTTFHVIVAVTALTAAATGKTPDNLVDRNSSSPSHKNSSDGNVLWIARRYFAIVAVAVILALLCLALFYRRTFFKCCVGTVATPRRDRRHFHFRGSNAHIPDELSFPYLYGRFSRDGESQDPFFHASSDTVDHPVGGFRRVIVRLLSHRRVLIFAGLPLRGRLPHHQPQHNHDVVGEASASASIEEGSDEEYGHIYVAMPAEATTGVELYNVDRILLDGREGTHNNPFGSTSSSTVEDEVLEGSPELSAVGSFSLPKQDNPYGEGYYTDVHGAVVMEHSLDVEIEASAFVEKDDVRR